VNVKTKLSDYLRPLVAGALLLGNAALIPLASAEVQPLDRVVAIVDNDVIMQSQLEQRIREVQQTIDKRGADAPPMDVLRQQVLERLITENLQLQIGERSGIRISDEELNQAMGTIAQRNNMTLEQFRSALANDGLSLETAREQIRREMIISRVRQRRIAERVQVSDQEVRNFLASDLGKLQLSEEYRLANILIAVPEGADSATIQAAERRANETYEQLQQGANLPSWRSPARPAKTPWKAARWAGARPPSCHRRSIATCVNWRWANSPVRCAHRRVSSSSSCWKNAAAIPRCATRCMFATS